MPQGGRGGWPEAGPPCGTAAAPVVGRERAAADRLFGFLPPDQSTELRGLWEEFEARRTPEGRFAAALDRLQPLVNNYLTEGRSWRQHGVTRAQVIERCRPIADGSPALWEYAARLVSESVARGYLAP